MAYPLFTDGAIYYGIGKCDGIKPNGENGNVVEIHRFVLDSGKDEIEFNLDHISGWTC